MDNHDTLYNQIKTAAQNAETKDFESMDKVWSRVEEKLDKKVLTKQNSLWKKLAVAASLLLVTSIGYQYFKEDEQLVLPKNNPVVNETNTPIPADSLTTKNAIVNVEKVNINIKENAADILKKQVSNGYAFTVNDTLALSPKSSKEAAKDNAIPVSGTYNSVSLNTSTSWMSKRKFDSRGVEHKEADEIVTDKSIPNETQENPKKEEPIIVINNLETNKQEVSNLSDDEIESIVELSNPLYIINSVYYTEKEVFGPNPTSPYSPLNKQNIETISILQDEKAISIYGEKGKNGVVIITTKDGKPAPKKR
jgi:TonB-dependent SusC/RagA subfamily outer membrane receptor